jgi:hypothetical protein
VDISYAEEYLTELLAHTVVLRAGADELTRVLSSRNVVLLDVLASADRIADRSAEVLRITRILSGHERDSTSPDKA